MARLITEDDVDDLAFGSLNESGSAAHLAVATQLEEWATNEADFELEEGLPASYLLVTAVDHCEMAGDFERAFRLADLAREHPSSGRFEVHPVLIRLHIAQGDNDAAARLADEVRAGAPDNPVVAYEIAAAFAEADELAAAQRWYAIGLRLCDEESGEDDEVYEMLVIGRFGVRRAADLPLDQLDEEALELLEEITAEDE